MAGRLALALTVDSPAVDMIVEAACSAACSTSRTTVAAAVK